MPDTEKAKSNMDAINSKLCHFEKVRAELSEFRKAVDFMDNDTTHNETAKVHVDPTTNYANSIQGNRGSTRMLYNSSLIVPPEIIEDLIRKRHAELEKEFIECSAIVDVFSRALR
ncbi:MAG: hypothetical protein JEZ12_28010 [Desulfobacterium sp.]|nr:hypothetical protein [Desulfobacterium sp.]